MHKYLPRVCIVEESGSVMGESPSRVFCFHETAFIAVTAYQNEKVSELVDTKLRCKHVTCAWNACMHASLDTASDLPFHHFCHISIDYSAEDRQQPLCACIPREHSL